MRRKYTSLPYTEYPVLAYDNESYRLPVDTIILHSTASTYESAIAWFNNPSAGTSAHYIIANDGRLAAMLEEYYVAFHAGNYTVNQKSIGIEHEGYTGMVRSDKEYDMSIKLVADICKFYSIPCDRNHIKAHREIVATACPTDLDIDRIVNGAKALLQTPASKPDPRGGYWDTLCLMFGLTGDSWIVTPDDFRKYLDYENSNIELSNEVKSLQGQLASCQSQTDSKIAEQKAICQKQIDSLTAKYKKTNKGILALIAQKLGIV